MSRKSGFDDFLNLVDKSITAADTPDNPFIHAGHPGRQATEALGARAKKDPLKVGAAKVVGKAAHLFGARPK